MKKSFGIFIIMGLILVSGTIITAFTKHYFDSRLIQTEQISQMFTEVDFAENLNEGSSLKETPADPDPRGLLPPDGDETLRTDEEAAPAPFDSPIKTLIEDDRSLAVVDGREEYERNLKELENDLQALWESEDAVTTKGMMAVAEYELAAWDLELNTIYQLLREKLPAEEFDIIKLEEREWVKERDAIAGAAAAEYDEGTASGLTYTKTLTEETRKRTYILVGYYFPGE